MAKINLVKLEMPQMSVWVKKEEVSLFKETFLSTEEIVVENTIKLNNKPRKFESNEDYASHILEGVSDSVPKGYSKKLNKAPKIINIDGHQHIVGGNEEVTDRASDLL